MCGREAQTDCIVDFCLGFIGIHSAVLTVLNNDAEDRFHALDVCILLRVESTNGGIDRIVAVFGNGDVRLDLLHVAAVLVGTGEGRGCVVIVG